MDDQGKSAACTYARLGPNCTRSGRMSAEVQKCLINLGSSAAKRAVGAKLVGRAPHEFDQRGTDATFLLASAPSEKLQRHYTVLLSLGML